jgi:16S rRNA (cytosine1402-N4)-methyltransferase
LKELIWNGAGSRDVELTVHKPVLVAEILKLFSEELAGTEEPVLFDCTLGGGGHAEAFLRHFPKAILLGCDQDESALRRCKERLGPFSERVQLMHGSFSEIERLLAGRNVDALLCDLGISSDQLDDRTRGFSFHVGEFPLDMRMDRSKGRTAQELLNELSFVELKRIFDQGGVRRNSAKLAQRICDERPVDSGRKFVEICESVLASPRERRLRTLRGGSESHPATVPFQALRIAVNDELGALNSLLNAIPKVANKVAAFITFHSLEDEIVTSQFRSWARPGGDRRAPTPGLGRHLTQKPILPGEEELAENSRSRSARLRAFSFKGGI